MTIPNSRMKVYEWNIIQEYPNDHSNIQKYNSSISKCKFKKSKWFKSKKFKLKGNMNNKWVYTHNKLQNPYIFKIGHSNSNWLLNHIL